MRDFGQFSSHVGIRKKLGKKKTRIFVEQNLAKNHESLLNRVVDNKPIGARLCTDEDGTILVLYMVRNDTSKKELRIKREREGM